MIENKDDAQRLFRTIHGIGMVKMLEMLAQSIDIMANHGKEINELLSSLGELLGGLAGAYWNDVTCSVKKNEDGQFYMEMTTEMLLRMRKPIREEAAGGDENVKFLEEWVSYWEDRENRESEGELGHTIDDLLKDIVIPWEKGDESSGGDDEEE